MPNLGFAEHHKSGSDTPFNLTFGSDDKDLNRLVNGGMNCGILIIGYPWGPFRIALGLCISQ